jgi:hypothetical protein
MKHQILDAFVSALERISGSPCIELRLVFAEVARRRPDLLSRSLFADRGRKSLEVEKVLRAVIAEMEQMERSGEVPLGMEVPYLGNLRLNHSTGRLHVGEGYRSALLFGP